MRTRNRVAKLTAVGRVEILQEDVPEPTAEEMLVQIEAAGICGSDLHYFRHGGLGSFKQKLPMPLGHEPAGTVVDPNGHAGFAVGDRVAVEPARPCLTSPWSLRGRHNLCKEGSFMGAQGQPGCFCDFVCVTPLQCALLPPTVGFEAAALLEPISVALHVANLSEAKFTDTVVIFGAGTIGLCCCLILRRAGVEQIYMVDRVAFRREFAGQFAATAAFSFEEARAQVKDRTGGRGCSLVIDTAGDDASLEACLHCAAVGGRLALVAIPEVDHLAYNPHQARTKEVRVINVHRSNVLLNESVALFSDVSAAAQLERLVTHRMPLESVQEAFQMAAGYSRGVLKIMLLPGRRRRRVRRVGLLGGGLHASPEYFGRLARDSGVEVCFAGCLALDGAGGPCRSAAFVDEQCSLHGVPFLGVISFSSKCDIERVASYECDLLLVGDKVTAEALRAVEPGQFARLASEGVVCTHLGLLPADQGCDPVMWAILAAQPQGATTYFAIPGDFQDPVLDDSRDAVVDMFHLPDEDRVEAATARALVEAEAARRLPGWLASLREGAFDMSAMRSLRLARRLRQALRGWRAAAPEAREALDVLSREGPPNDKYVSWHWKGEFLERFSHSLGRVRTRISDEDGCCHDLWFSIQTTCQTPLDGLPALGVVVGASASSRCFVVRAAEGLVTCQADEASPVPHAGVVLQGAPEIAGGIPPDFGGAELLSSIEDPPPPPAHSAPRPSREFAKDSTTAIEPAPEFVGSGAVAAGAALRRAEEACGAPVAIYDLRFEDAFVTEFQQKAAEVLTSGRPLSESKFCRAFEAAFAELVSPPGYPAPLALVTPSGTAALSIALRAVGVKGKAVITPSNTFFATQVAVENAGGRVRFAECEADYMQLCPRSLRTLLAAQPAGSVAAVVLVHIGGIIAPFATELRDIAREHGAALVEDAAHAHTSHLDGVGWAGSIGDIAAFSFFPTKVMTTGEGGMITTRSEALFKACKDIKTFGADLTKGASRLTCLRADGTNGRVPEMSALLGLLECGRVRERVEKRQELLAEYVRGLDGCEAFRVLQQPGGSCSYYKCIVHLRGVDKEFLRSFAKERGIAFTGEVYHLGVHEMPAFEKEHPEPLPITQAACAGHVCPPLYPELTLEEVRRVCAVMREAATAWKSTSTTRPSGYP